MNRNLLALALILATPWYARAEFDLEGWAWERAIELDNSASGFVRLPIDAEVFDESQASLQDLRVLDPGGNLVPHVLKWTSAEDTTNTKWRDVTMINSVFQPESYSRVTLDFGESVRKNLVRVQLSNENFRRRLSIEGSGDNVNWNVVTENRWLFDIHQQGRVFVMDTIQFPVNDFRYLRLTVDNMADDPRRVTIERVESAIREVVEKKSLVLVPATEVETSFDEDTRESVIDIDLGLKNLPVAMIDIQIEDPHFFRGVSVSGRNSVVEEVRRKTEVGWDTVERDTPWSALHRGVLFRIHDEGSIDENTVIEGISGPYRYLQMRVDNGDNPPLDVSEVRVFRREAGLVFESDGAGPYRLIGGNPDAPAPRYDLGRSIVGVGMQDLPMTRLAAMTRLIPTEKQLPWTERNAVLIWVVLIAAVSAMAVLVVRSLKSLSQADTAPRDDTKQG